MKLLYFIFHLQLLTVLLISLYASAAYSFDFEKELTNLHAGMARFDKALMTKRIQGLNEFAKAIPNTNASGHLRDVMSAAYSKYSVNMIKFGKVLNKVINEVINGTNSKGLTAAVEDILKNRKSVTTSMINRVIDEAAKEDLFVAILLTANEMVVENRNLFTDPQVVKAVSKFFNSKHVSQDLKEIAYYDLQGEKVFLDAQALLLIQNLNDVSIDEFLGTVRYLLKGYKIPFPRALTSRQKFKNFVVLSLVSSL